MWILVKIGSKIEQIFYRSIDKDLNSNILVYRMLFTIGALFYLIYGAIGEYILSIDDPILLRLVVVLFIGILMGLTFKKEIGNKYLPDLLKISIHVMNLHFIYLIILNQLSILILLYLIIYISLIVAMIPYAFRDLSSFNRFSIILGLELIFAFLYVQVSKTPKLPFILIITMFLVMIYFTGGIFILTTEKFQTSRERMEFVIKNSPIVFFIMDENGELTYCKGRGLQPLGIDQDELVGKNVFEEFPNQSSMLSNLEKALDGEEVRDFVHFQNLVYDTYWAPYSLVAKYGDRSIEEGIMGIAIEITDHYNTIEKLEQAQEALIQNQKLEAVGRLSSSIAHDFNNLLSVISLNNELIQYFIDSGEYEGIENQVAEIQKNIRHGEYLTDRLTSLSKSKINQPEKIELNENFQNLEATLRRLLEDNIELSIDYTEGNQFDKIDPARLEQMILNLVINSRDAINNRDAVGKGKIVIDIEREEIDEIDFSKISVKDNGIGIDKETKQNLLKPFYSTKDEGSGLGLYSVKKIIDELGGKITIESEHEQGTVVELYLPQTTKEDQIPKTEEIEQMKPTTFTHEKVLIVEDEQSIRVSLANILEQYGLNVTVTSEAGKALEKLKNSHYDLLITDVILPGMSGIELSEKAWEIYPDLFTIYISGYTDDIGKERLKRENVEFLSKPFDSKKLIKVIEDLFGIQK